MRAFRVAYDGRPFHGFQRQPDVPTVEDAIFDALRALDVFLGDAPEGYSAAGRTDAGVSALSQTVALDAPDWLTPRALDAELPSTVHAWASADVGDDFHATADANWREYVYFLYAPDLEAERAREALEALCGEHDYHNLTPDDERTVRTIGGAVSRDGPHLVVTLRAGGFSRQLVRRVVSLVRSVASGAAPPAKIDRVLADEPLDGPEGVAPAPPLPLVLSRVDYDAAFRVEEAAAAAARESFAELAAERRTGARVARYVAEGVS
ncbi:MAG: tRNA pseudouridine(38-40) synthase TruA [Halanaeroarchaeum sp.]